MKAPPSLLLVSFACLVAAPASASAGFEGRRCAAPTGHGIADCRVARHGTPDLSRAAWRALRGKEVTIGVRIDSLAPNFAAGGARRWPLVDSLGQPMGSLEMPVGGRGLVLRSLDGSSYRMWSVRMRGRGCAASLRQQRRFTLVQINGASPTGGGQGFVDTAALDQSTASGRVALAAFRRQRGGGTGCGPGGREVGRLRRLADPRVGAAAHARLSDGTINTVTEYDAKPEFGNTVYFMSNTTQVSVGGIARGMARRDAGGESRLLHALRSQQRRDPDVALLVDPDRRAGPAAAVRVDPGALPGADAAIGVALVGLRGRRCLRTAAMREGRVRRAGLGMRK